MPIGVKSMPILADRQYSSVDFWEKPGSLQKLCRCLFFDEKNPGSQKSIQFLSGFFKT